MKKQELRLHFNTLRDTISVKDKKFWDELINQKLLEYILKSNPEVVHTYLPMGSEIDFYPVIDFLLKRQIKVVCPKTMEKPNLQHFQLNSINDLEQGKFGTKYPKGDNEYHGDYDLIIVPGLAFNSQNYRLGYGGGYYDYFLKNHPNTVKLGLFYSFQQIEDLPIESYDIPLDIILTN